MNLNQSKKRMSYILMLAMVVTFIFGSGMFAVKAFATVTPKPIKNMPLNKEGTVVANWDQENQTLRITGNGKIDSGREYWWALPAKFGITESGAWANYGEKPLEAFTLDMSDKGVRLPDDCQELFSMFPGEIKMNPELDTSNVTDMTSMFDQTPLANVDVSNWDLSNVTRIGGMFTLAEKMNPDVSKWDVRNVRDVSDAFLGSGVEKLDLSNWNLHEDCEGFESFLLGIPKLKEVKIKNFYGPVGFLSVDDEESGETHTMNGFAAPYYISTCDDNWNITKTEGPYANDKDPQYLGEAGNYIISITPPAAKVKVTFDAHDGNGVKVVEVNKGELLEAPKPEPTKDEHKFLGWFTKEEGGDKWDFENGKVEEAMTLHAHWEKAKYQVKTNVTGGNATVTTAPNMAAKGDEVKVDVKDIEKGKQLKSITADGKPVKNGGTFTMPGKEVTVEVVLEDKPVEKYAVKTNVAGGTATVTTTPDMAAKGDEIKVDVTDIEKGKQLKSITVDGKPVKNGGTFTMPGKEVTVEVVLEDKPTTPEPGSEEKIKQVIETLPEETLKIIEERFKDGVFEAYDIYFTRSEGDQTEKYNPTEEMKVEVTLDKIKTTKIKVYHINANGAFEDVKSEKIDKIEKNADGKITVTFWAKDFSPYVFVEGQANDVNPEPGQPDPANPENPEVNPDNPQVNPGAPNKPDVPNNPKPASKPEPTAKANTSNKTAATGDSNSTCEFTLLALAMSGLVVYITKRKKN